MWRGILRFASGLFLAFMVPACGGNSGNSDGNYVPVAPIIANFFLNPDFAYLNSGGGTIDVLGTFDFEDPNGDLRSLTLTILDFAGEVLNTGSVPLEGAQGIRNGYVVVEAWISTATVATYTICVTVTDARNLISNELTTNFRITPDPWVSKAPMPTRRTGCSVVAVGELIYVLGGYLYGTGTPGIPSTAVEIYNPANDTWMTGVPMPFFRDDFMAAAVSGIIHMVETNFILGKPPAAHLAFDPASGLWSSRASIPLPARPAVAGLQGRLYVMGGGNPGEVGKLDVHVYDPMTDTWSLGTPLPFDTYGFATSTADKIVTLNLIYDLGSDTWSFMTSHPSSPRDFGKFGWVAAGDQCFLIGGTLYGTAVVSVDAYDISTGLWHGKAPLPHTVYHVGAATVNGKVYEFGVLDTLEYTPANDPR